MSKQNEVTVLKRLFFDIEVSPNIVTTWSAGYKQKVDYHDIIKERSIICICYKWGHEKKVNSLQWDSKQNDKSMLKDFAKVIEQADEVVGHNSKSFDTKWLRTRCLFHNIPLPTDLKQIDTLSKSRSYFRFNSNRLDYISQYLGAEGKIKTDPGLWRKILIDKCDKSLTDMVRYCKNDVLILEDVYNKIEKYFNHETHAAVLHGGKKHQCPKCQSENTHISKTRVSATGIIKRQMTCRDCGCFFTISNKTYEEKVMGK